MFTFFYRRLLSVVYKFNLPLNYQGPGVLCPLTMGISAVVMMMSWSLTTHQPFWVISVIYQPWITSLFWVGLITAGYHRIPQDPFIWRVLMNFSILLHNHFPIDKTKYYNFFVGRNGRTLNKIKTLCHVSRRIMQCILSFQLAPHGGVTRTC